ncbi:MAG TPA: cation:proton antiporter [Planctomycetes bacterium]|nr:cation:proton antiporter [Planctomycetota bacterium]
MLKSNDVLRQVSKLLVPFIVVFGVYVITHGELGPGGGFQGGVIIAAGYILYALIYGLPAARQLVPRWASDTAAPLGVLIYASVGVYSLLRGKTFLDYDVLNPSHPELGQPLGMTLVELGVGLTVASVMVTVFNEVVEGAAPNEEERKPDEGPA